MNTRMFLKAIFQIKLLKFSFKKLFFLSYLALGLVNKSNVISQPIINQNLDEESKISNISFITKAVKKTGASVVTDPFVFHCLGLLHQFVPSLGW